MGTSPIQLIGTKDLPGSLGEGGFARTNQFQVTINNGWGYSNNGKVPFIEHLNNKSLKSIYGFTWDSDMKTLMSFSCADASLPASTYATSEVKDNFMGVTEEFAHTRINTDIDFTFYVDGKYKILMFFEAWMNFVSGGNSGPEDLDEPSIYDDVKGTSPLKGYYRRFNYPKHYKNANGVYISKFEKNYGTPGSQFVTYQMINTFPKSVNAIPLSYGGAEIMKVTVSLNYDRYRIYRGSVANEVETIDDFVIQPYTSESTGSQSTLAQLADQGAFGPQ